MRELRKKFRNLPKQEEVVENIKFLCETKTKQKITSMRGGENILCKLGRIMVDTDKKYSDIWEENFVTYEVINGKKIIFGKGSVCHGPLLSNKDGRWRKNCEFDVLSTKKSTWMDKYM